jgi:hypothetical protein
MAALEHFESLQAWLAQCHGGEAVARLAREIDGLRFGGALALLRRWYPEASDQPG